MKTTTILLALTSLALKQVSAAALPEPEYHEVSKNEFGSLYSNVPSHQRRDAENIKYHPIDVNEHGTVYSSVAPDLSKRSDAYTPLDPEAAAAFIKDNDLSKRDEAEKRADWQACVACVAACGLMQQGISLLSVSQQVQFCLGNCVTQGACNPYYRARYGDTYDNTFPPQ